MNKENHKIIYAPFSYPADYKVGSVVEGNIFAFSSLNTAVLYESLGYYGYVPFSDRIAVAETVGSYIEEPLAEGIQDLCVRAEGMRVTGIKRFLNGIEVE